MEIPIITYRIATEKDAQILALLSASTFRESWIEEGNEADINLYLSQYFTNEQIKRELEDETIIYLLAFNGDEVIGYSKSELNLQPEGYELDLPFSISRVYIDKQYQRMKVGSGLLKQTIDIAREQDFKTIWLGVWNQNNDAIRLYQRFGFSQFGHYKFVMGSIVSDDYLMWLKL